MYWHSQSDMYFRLAGGYTGEFAPFEFQRMPVVNYFYGGIDLREAADQLKSYLARFNVQAIVAEPAEANFSIFEQPLESLRLAPIQDRAVWLYKLPTGASS